MKPRRALFMPRRNLYAIVMVGAVSLLCWQVSQGAKPKDDVSEMYGVFVDAVEQVQQNYVRSVTRRELMESALRGMLSDLDPHSTYINTSQWKTFKRQIEGKFGGLGMTVEIDEDSKRLKVVAPMVGTPAYAAGVLAGDLILDIDGVSTEGLTIDKAVDCLQGQPGTTVKLNVLHEDPEKAEVLTLTRAIIEVPSVMGDRRKPNDEWDFMLNKDKKIGYIRITNFIQDTTDHVKDALEELQKEGMKGLILDLRDDPGGLLSAAVEISDLFVEEGKIVSTRGRNTTEKTFEAHKDGTFTGFPMAVLVNHNSASASEILSACLQDHDRAVVIGERSFGKGSVQNILDLEDGNSVLKLTVATYWRPSGKNIHRFKNAKDTDEWGVTPNPGMEVKLSREDYHDWFIGRRNRDFLSSRNKPKAEKPKADEAKKDEKPKADEAKKDEKDEKKDKPFVDKQLDKAIAVLSEKIK
jgi:carboxyl-terminal processing protease